MKPIDLSNIDLTEWDLNITDTLEKVILRAAAEAIKCAAEENACVLLGKDGCFRIQLPLGSNVDEEPEWSFSPLEETTKILDSAFRSDKDDLTALRDSLTKAAILIDDWLKSQE